MSSNLEKALKLCRKHARSLDLPMNVLNAQYDPKDRKVLFTYESERRVDFRELLKLLQNDLKIKIELRQVGPRDKARQLGGVGSCGRVCCCKLYKEDFSSITMKMLKAQGLSGNPQKYSGYCGKLRCCIEYEYCPHEKGKMAGCKNCIKTRSLQ